MSPCHSADISKDGGSGSFSVTLGADKANSGSAGELFGVLPSTATSCSRGEAISNNMISEEQTECGAEGREARRPALGNGKWVRFPFSHLVK